MADKERSPEEIREINRAFIAQLEKTPIDPEFVAAISGFTRIMSQESERRHEVVKRFLDPANWRPATPEEIAAAVAWEEQQQSEKKDEQNGDRRS